MRVVLFFVALIIFSVPSFSVSAQDASSAQNVIIVDNNGSAEYSGYHLVIELSGQVIVTAHGKAGEKALFAYGQHTISTDLVKALFDDLDAAMPISQLEPDSCLPSASMGDETYVTYKGETTPNIDCLKHPKNFVHILHLIKKVILHS